MEATRETQNGKQAATSRAMWSRGSTFGEGIRDGMVRDGGRGLSRLPTPRTRSPSVSNTSTNNAPTPHTVSFPLNLLSRCCCPSPRRRLRSPRRGHPRPIPGAREGTPSRGLPRRRDPLLTVVPPPSDGDRRHRIQVQRPLPPPRRCVPSRGGRAARQEKPDPDPPTSMTGASHPVGLNYIASRLDALHGLEQLARVEQLAARPRRARAWTSSRSDHHRLGVGCWEIHSHLAMEGPKSGTVGLGFDLCFFTEEEKL